MNITQEIAEIINPLTWRLKDKSFIEDQKYAIEKLIEKAYKEGYKDAFEGRCEQI